MDFIAYSEPHIWLVGSVSSSYRQLKCLSLLLENLIQLQKGAGQTLKGL